MIEIILTSLFLLFFSVVLHELGHLYVLRSHSPKAQIHFYYDNWRRFGFKTGEKKDYLFLSRKKRIGVGIVGVVVGVIPILLFSIINDFYLLLLAPYIIGCFHDFQIIIEDVKNEYF